MEENRERNDKFQTTRVVEKKPLYSKSYAKTLQSKEISKRQTQVAVSEACEKSKLFLMRSQTQAKQTKYCSSSLSSDETIHSIYCPMRSQSKQQKGNVRTEYSHCEACPTGFQPRQKIIRNYRTSCVYSEKSPLRVQKNPKGESTSSKTAHSEFSMRSTAKQKPIIRNYSARPSQRYSESCKLKLPSKENIPRKYHKPRTTV